MEIFNYVSCIYNRSKNFWISTTNPSLSSFFFFFSFPFFLFLYLLLKGGFRGKYYIRLVVEGSQLY